MWRTSLHGRRHGRGLSAHPGAHTYRLPMSCRGQRQSYMAHVKDSRGVALLVEAMPEQNPRQA